MMGLMGKGSELQIAFEDFLGEDFMLLNAVHQSKVSIGGFPGLNDAAGPFANDGD